MSSKARLIEQVQRNLAQFDRTRDEQIDSRDIAIKLCQLTNEMARRGLFENMKLDYNSVDPQFITTFRNLEVKLDEDYDLEFVKLPARYVALPHNKGVDFVGPMKNREIGFLVTSPTASGSYATSPAANMEGRNSCWEEGGRLYFRRKPSEDGYEKLLVRLVVADALSIDNDADFPIPADYQNELVEKATAWFIGLGQVQKDTINDNN